MAHALITGASKGIGKCIAEELAMRGYNLLLTSRSEELLKEVSSHLSHTYNVVVNYLVVDLSNHKSVEQLYLWCKSNNFNVNILVNNAGYGLSGKFEKYPLEQNLDMMQVNMVSPIQLCHLLLPILRNQTKSYILNVASSAAYQPVPGLSIYAASKSFILNFSRGLRQELKNSNVSVSCVCPGPTDTDFIIRANVGQRGLKVAHRVNLSPQRVAKIAINGMFAGKAEIVTGFRNKISVFFAWLLPKSILEHIAQRIYR